MDKQFITAIQKRRIARRENILKAFNDVLEYEPDTPKNEIVKFLAKKHKVSESTVRNILSKQKNLKEE